MDMRSDDVTLWRPTGPEELALVEQAGWTRWPRRLPDQPIFYPVLNEDYAVRIARDWNVAASGTGHVTRFRVRREFLDEFDVQQVGGPDHPGVLDSRGTARRTQRQPGRPHRGDPQFPPRTGRRCRRVPLRIVVNASGLRGRSCA